MSTLAEIEAAVAALPEIDQQSLLISLVQRISPPSKGQRPKRARRGLKTASEPALEGLPSDLSVGIKDRIRALMTQRHAADR